MGSAQRIMRLSEGRRSLLRQFPTKTDIIWVSNNNLVLTHKMGSHKSILNMNINTYTGNKETRGKKKKKQEGKTFFLTLYFLLEHSLLTMV